uniref:Uncharacterized protein MANES_06G140400 n=1 Tax=Rhizophora mucronata TaxID=61149 RepID=A0A2P2Q4I4_RHIMU
MNHGYYADPSAVHH